MWVNAVFMPAVAPKASMATTKAYSTRFWLFSWSSRADRRLKRLQYLNVHLWLPLEKELVPS
jgi:hypothetical protein